MKMIKMALLGGAAMAVTAAGAQADDLEALKAQIAELNARMAAMETAPSVPAGYQLIAVSEGETVQTPGLGLTAQERFAYGNRSTVISVLPTADAPAGTTITWSGYARAGLVFQNVQTENEVEVFDDAGDLIPIGEENGSISTDTDVDDWDVKARGQLRVTASTDTAVGEVGVDIRLRGDFNGNGNADAYMDVAWGYWAMTPELTFGGGYAGSLGNIGYGYDGACTCYYTDNADLAFNPGDTTQLRLSYGSGPFSMAVALEDASLRAPGQDLGETEGRNGDQLGAAGEIKYSGDTFSGEIAGSWRGIDDETYTFLQKGSTLDGSTIDSGLDSSWQVGAGVGFGLGDIANFSVAAAMGEGPFTQETEGVITGVLPINQSWWGVTALARFNLSDEFSAELAGGYKKREGDDSELTNKDGDIYSFSDIEYDTYGFLGGVYYTPVDQLTIGVEAEWYTTTTDFNASVDEGGDDSIERTAEGDLQSDTFSVDLVSVWRF